MQILQKVRVKIAKLDNIDPVPTAVAWLRIQQNVSNVELEPTNRKLDNRSVWIARPGKRNPLLDNLTVPIAKLVPLCKPRHPQVFYANNV